MINEDRQAILEEETYILRDSGEIPEIAFHATVFYLTEDEEGPLLRLTGEEIELLQDAALKRFEEIVLRDLDPANRDLGIYRGIRRTIYNWRRLQTFCKRSGRCCPLPTHTVAQALVAFLRQELTDVSASNRTSSVNCSVKQLHDLSTLLDLSPDSLPKDWQKLCLK